MNDAKHGPPRRDKPETQLTRCEAYDITADAIRRANPDTPSPRKAARDLIRYAISVDSPSLRITGKPAGEWTVKRNDLLVWLHSKFDRKHIRYGPIEHTVEVCSSVVPAGCATMSVRPGTLDRSHALISELEQTNQAHQAEIHQLRDAIRLLEDQQQRRALGKRYGHQGGRPRKKK